MKKQERKSNTQTTKEQFYKIKRLQEAGLKDCEIAELMNVGQTRLSCVKKFDTYEEYMDGRSEVYANYRKEQNEEKPEDENEPDSDQYKWVQELGLLRRQNEILQEQNETLKLISNKLAFIVEQLG